MLRERYPDQPWYWRREWLENDIHDRPATPLGCLWPFTILWLLVTGPSAFLFTTRGAPVPVRIMVMLFPIVGIGLLLWAIYLTVRARKYGPSHLHLDRIPVSPGTTLRGTLDARMHELPEGGIHLRLSAILRVITGAGKSRSVSESVLWQDEQTIRTATPGPDGLRIPFTFTLPPEAPPCDDSDSRRVTLWRLEATAETVGIDYAAQFELPVFRTGESEAAADAFAATPASWALPAQSEVVISVAPSGGEELRLDVHRGFAAWFVPIAFFTIWFGVLFVFRSLGAPLAILSIFVFIGLIVMIAVGDFLAGRSSVQADSRGLRIRRTWFGAGGTKTVDAAEISGIATKIGFQSGTKVYYDVEVTKRDGRKVSAARHFASRVDAERFAARLMHLTNVKA